MNNYITYIDNFLWGSKLSDINLKKLIEESLEIEYYVEKNFSNDISQNKFFVNLNSTNKFYLYNFFSFPFFEAQKLFSKIKESILPCLPKDNYLMQSWVNVYHKGQFVDWHGHVPKEYKAIHGFFCVNTETEASYTDYKFDHMNEIVRVKSEDGLLVFGKSFNDLHRSSVWNNDTPRITIAFDIVPASTYEVGKDHSLRNNFVPFA